MQLRSQVESTHLLKGDSAYFGRESFMLELIAHLSKLTDFLFGNHLGREYIVAIGLQMGEAIDERFKRFHRISGRLSLDQYASLVVNLKQSIGGDFYLVEKASNKVVVASNTCPFGGIITKAPNLCMITSGVFGGIAALNFGFGKVVLRKRIGLGEPRCEVCIYSENRGECAHEDGVIYTPEAVTSVNEHMRVRFDAHKIIQAQEEERKRIALELHDGPLQALVNLHYRLEIVEHLLQLKRARAYKELNQLELALASCITDIKSLLVNMRPPILDDLGVVPALRRLLCDFRRDSKVKAKITVKGTTRRLSASVEIALYRIIEEALANVKRHARASAVELILEYDLQNLVVRLTDNGMGFDSREVLSLTATQRNLGLLGMIDRAGLLGGSIDINSQRGKGTEIVVSVPLE